MPDHRPQVFDLKTCTDLRARQTSAVLMSDFGWNKYIRTYSQTGGASACFCIQLKVYAVSTLRYHFTKLRNLAMHVELSMLHVAVKPVQAPLAR